jgi:aminoglycoside phosphotransferase (APT) family kinase protein
LELNMASELETVAGHFAVDGKPTTVKPFNGGHINDSFLVTYRQEDGSARFLLQRINEAVFPDPALVTANIQRVTSHIVQKLKSLGVPDINRRVPTLVRTNEGGFCHRDQAGSCWRLYRFVEDVRVCQKVDTPGQAEQAGRAFGAFQSLLADLPGPRLHETIPGFHDTPSRFEALDRVVRADPRGRTAEAQPEIDYAFVHRASAGALCELHRAGEIPERVAHNDAKISNVLFDRETGEALCVVDLDTVMPGLALNDFGDMVRSMTCPAAEDERDLSAVEVEMSLFEALARSYVEASAGFLTPVERANLVTAGKLITLEQGVRFLTDFLNGDTYYRTQRPNQNLDRCRTQFKLVESITQHEARMVHFIDSP